MSHLGLNWPGSIQHTFQNRYFWRQHTQSVRKWIHQGKTEDAEDALIEFERMSDEAHHHGPASLSSVPVGLVASFALHQ